MIDDLEITPRDTRWYIGERILHRINGPAVERANGDKLWYQNGKLHRVDGPAADYASGDKHWYLNGLRHRIGGPAFTLNNGRNHWYKDGLLHREDGPAVVFKSYLRWYLKGERIKANNQAEFLRMLKIKAFW
jgi:hypothetical protein